jgi:hypothetical protein
MAACRRRLLTWTAPAWAANVVNVTIRIPAQVEPQRSGCAQRPATHRAVHTEDGQGGYHVSETAKEMLAGASLVTGAKYGTSKTDTWTWFAGTPFPAVNTHTIDTELSSRAGTDNFIAHTTINAAGVPTVTVDTVRLECAG